MGPDPAARRLFSLKDLEERRLLVNALPEIDFAMSVGIPADVMGRGSKKGGNVYLQQYLSMVENTAKPVVFVCDDRRDGEAIIAMASSLAGGEELLRLNPTFLLYSEPTTPLQHSHTATDKRLAAADVIGWLGPGGNFLTEDHTLSQFREMWEPSLFERRRAEEWMAGGAPG